MTEKNDAGYDAVNFKLVTSIVAPKQRAAAGGTCLFSKVRSAQTMAPAHIVPTPTTSAQKAAGCQREPPGLVMDFGGVVQ